MNTPKWLKSPIKGIILDVSGVLRDGDSVIAGSLEAIARLQTANFPFCLLSNESTCSVTEARSKLTKLGFNIPQNKLLTPVPVMKNILRERNLRPHVLVNRKVEKEFLEFDCGDPNCVVVADAEDNFCYDRLNECFRKLMQMKEPLLFSLGFGKYYKDERGLVLDVGPFAKGLEYALNTKAIIVGKPEPTYFQFALDNLCLKAEEVVMVGDDIMYDVGGAQKCGIRGILVRSGKFIPSDENHPIVKPDAIVDNFSQVVELILKHHSGNCTQQASQ